MNAVIAELVDLCWLTVKQHYSLVEISSILAQRYRVIMSTKNVARAIDNIRRADEKMVLGAPWIKGIPPT